MEQSCTTHTKAAQDNAMPRQTELTEAHRGAAHHSTRQRSTRVRGQHNTTHSVEQSKAAHHNGGGQPQHAPQTPTLAQHPTPKAGARPTTRATHPCTTTTANKQGTHAGHHQRPTTLTPMPTPHPPHKTTKATRTHTTQKGCFPDALPGANTFPTTRVSGGSPNLSRGFALAGGWQPATWLTIGH